ncbi:TerD family protein [Streptomyces sp. 6-11-2]|uniref:TerD family protein n=1 Tax=Streptomyces sp. 6-11-2 TaxID=2585753 RepID=UPI001144F831|nr:TerD family protein [Streptomyces sp. 6-11-2]GED87660.1 export associated protein [Streptomyces sp. 6-11-2]
MTAELVRGQNHPLSEVRLEIRISAGCPVVAAATLSDDSGRARGAEWVVHPGAPVLPGLEVSRQAAADHRLAVDLGAIPEAVHRVDVLLALPAASGGPTRFGAVAAPFVAVTGPDGTELASYTITGLDAESAVIAMELYRRQDSWKVRAVGQGYAGGLTELLSDLGLTQAAELATATEEAVAEGLARSVAAPPPRTTDEARSHQASAPPGPNPAASVSSHEGSSHEGQVSGTAGPSAPQSAGPGGSGGGTPAAGPTTSVPAGGTIDYRHPRRQPAPPPGQPAQPAPPSVQPAPPPRQPSAPSGQPAAPPAAPAASPGHAGQPARPVAGDATGWSMEERLYNQVWGMFEDLARTTAAYRSAVDFAESRMEKELDQVLSDPRSRIGGQGDAAREAARAKHARLVDQARASLDRDLAQLTDESEVVEPALPAAYARWDNPVWHGYRVPMEIPMAVRLGDLHLPEDPSLRIPMLIRLPLERGLWIDSGRWASPDETFADAGERRRLAMEAAVAHAARLIAVYPAGEFGVHVIDPAGSGAQALAPLVHTGVLAGPPAAGAAGVADVLSRLTQRVDLVQMAVRGGAPDALPPGFDAAEQLLIVNDFPHGFDDRAVTQLRYLADEGPAVGVHLMMVADREDAAAYGPLLDPLWRSLMRLTPVPDDHLADPWVGHAWTYEPPVVPPGSQVLQLVLTEVAAARRDGSR